MSPMVDYEGELAVVIGRRGRRVPLDRAAEVIAGYTIVNDVSVLEIERIGVLENPVVAGP